MKNMHLQFFGFPRRHQDMSETPSVKGNQYNPAGIHVSSSKYKKFKWKKTNFKTCLPKHNPVVIYVTANTKNIESMQCMMHAGTLIQGNYSLFL
tara:strand:+ start:532 stop:813 length:282 start_codon:yes stop_codon:yes gene_type:complete